MDISSKQFSSITSACFSSWTKNPFAQVNFDLGVLEGTSIWMHFFLKIEKKVFGTLNKKKISVMRVEHELRKLPAYFLRNLTQGEY